MLTPGTPGAWLGDDDSNAVIRYGAWDSHKVHDPQPLVRGGQVWLYYKGQPMGWGTGGDGGIGWGVATADRPEGPFVKSPLNPVTNSGHETLLFPYREGIAAICNHDGPEKDTVQYAPDGLNFEVKAHVVLPPPAGAPYAPDLFTDSGNGHGITWGLAHLAREELKRGSSYLVRFDCNLSRDLERPGFRRSNHRFPESVYFSPDLLFSTAIAPRDADLAGSTPYQPSPASVAGCVEASAATRRVHEVYGAAKDQGSAFFSAFKYLPVSGIGKQPGVSRRDPSKVIRVGGTYYVWYTRRRGRLRPQASPAPPTRYRCGTGTWASCGTPPVPTATHGRNADGRLHAARAAPSTTARC